MLGGLQSPHLPHYQTWRSHVPTSSAASVAAVTEALKSTERNIRAQALVVINFPRSLEMLKQLRCSIDSFVNKSKYSQNMLGRKLAAAVASLLTQAKWSYTDTLRFLVDAARFQSNGQVTLFRSNLSWNFHEFPTLLADLAHEWAMWDHYRKNPESEVKCDICPCHP